ncbi:MAG TPA: hypothetical protein VD840_06415 [Sinorhizobium sp.]|nr:hypothetical protein [Sinorhizobium sp.]
MDRMGGGSRSMQASRLLAVLWLFCASFSMQAIAVGQRLSARAGAGAQPGDVAAPDAGSSDRPAARQVSRAVALPDFRFVGARADGKSLAGGDPAPALLLEFSVLPAVDDGRPMSISRMAAANEAPRGRERIRAPPPTQHIL